MPSSVTYYEDPLNIDYLMPAVRMAVGDLIGDIFSDTTIRTSIVYAVTFLQKRWASKYQVFSELLLVDPQPDDVPVGFMRINAVGGFVDIPDSFVNGDVFRNPYLVFSQEMPPIIQSNDEMGIVLAAKILLRRIQISSSATSFISWSTEDVRFSNLGAERSLTKLLEVDLTDLEAFFKQSLATPIKIEFPYNITPTFFI
jgi:hypothetical protein